MKRVTVRRSSIHGKGVFALRALVAGERIFEYKGLDSQPTAAPAPTPAPADTCLNGGRFGRDLHSLLIH